MKTDYAKLTEQALLDCLPGLNCRERVLIESMLCGTPVIGSSSGEIPLVIADAGLVFPEGDAAVLADRIERLMNEPELRERLRDKGRDRVLAHYTWEKVAQATANIIREVAGQC